MFIEKKGKVLQRILIPSACQREKGREQQVQDGRKEERFVRVRSSSEVL